MIISLYPEQYTMVIILNCLITGKDSYRKTFNVKINEKEMVIELRKAVKVERPQAFVNLDSIDIRL